MLKLQSFSSCEAWYALSSDKIAVVFTVLVVINVTRMGQIMRIIGISKVLMLNMIVLRPMQNDL